MIGPDCGREVFSDVQFRVIDVALVTPHGPFCRFLRTDRVGPTESHDARPDGDTEPSGFRLDPATGRTRRPRRCRFEQCRSGGDHLGTREPQTQRVDRPQLPGCARVVHRFADIFGTYNKPAGRGRVEVGCLGRRTADRCRSRALRPGGLGRSRPPVHRGTRRTGPQWRAVRSGC